MSKVSRISFPSLQKYKGSKEQGINKNKRNNKNQESYVCNLENKKFIMRRKVKR